MKKLSIALLSSVLVPVVVMGAARPQDADAIVDNASDDGVAAVEEEQPAPWDGTYAEGFVEMARLARAGSADEALAIAKRMLEPNAFARFRARLESGTGGFSERLFDLLDGPLTWLGFETHTQADRAEIHYAMGLLHERTGAIQSAEESMELARALAGPGRTRLDAMYDLGTFDLYQAEFARAKIPEISGRPAPPASAIPLPDQPPDYLPIARALYERAREDYVERLRVDWRDPDTRANVELLQRRLRELDEIQRERDRQQKEKESEQENSEEGEDGQNQEDSGQSDPDAEQQEGDESKQEDQRQGSDEENEGEEPEAKPVENEASDPELSEMHLTEEEMKRLQERLENHEEEGARKREQLKAVPRVRVERDW